MDSERVKHKPREKALVLDVIVNLYKGSVALFVIVEFTVEGERRLPLK
jgi:hypothetical protein